MRWLHISDLHCDPKNSNTGTLMMRDALPSFLRKNNLQVDAMFVSGDFRFAQKQADTDQNAQIAVDMLFEIAAAAGVTKEDGTVNADMIFTVPGNHDLDRKYPNREDLIKPIKDKYIESFEEGVFEKDNLSLLFKSFSFYHRVLNLLHGETESKNRFEKMFTDSPHTHVFIEDICVLMLNTALLSQDSATVDPRSLLIGHNYITRELIQIRNRSQDIPIIILAHHSMEQLNEQESRELEKIFKNYDVKLYLCGHSHELWRKTVNDLTHITMGCIGYGNVEQAGFSRYEYNPTTGKLTIQAYEWRHDINSPRWVQYPGLSSEENGLLCLDLNDIKKASQRKTSEHSSSVNDHSIESISKAIIPTNTNIIDKEILSHLDNYKSSLLEQYAKVKLLQFADSLDEEDTVDVDSIYVDLSCDPFSRAIVTHKGNENRERGLSCSAVLEAAKNVVFLGLPGAGKTTLLRHLLKKSSNENNCLLPIFIELKSEVDGEFSEILRKGTRVNRNDIYAFVRNYLSNYGASNALLKFVENKTAPLDIVFFCDGLDEISPEQYKEFTNAVNKASSFAGLSFVISSRQIGFRSSDYSEKFKMYCLRDFGKGEQKKFINKFFSAGSEERQKKLLKYASQQHELVNSLDTSETIEKLAKSPILLSLLCVTPSLKTIKNKAQLFGRAIEVLLRNRKIESVEDQTLFTDFLKELAVVFFKLDKAECFEKSELEFYADRFFCRQDEDTCSRLKGKYLDCGLFDKSEKRDAYKFAHRTIWEYLVAEGMLSRDKNEVYSRANMVVWEEPIKMFVSLIEQGTRNQKKEITTVIKEIWKTNKALALSCMNEFEVFPREVFENLYGSLSKRDKLRLIATLNESYENNPSDFRLPVINTIKETLTLIHTEERNCEVVYAYLEFLEKNSNERVFGELLEKFLDLTNLARRQKRMKALGLEFVEIKAGTFKMGRSATNRNALSPEERKRLVTIDSEETPEHKVRISQRFFLAKTPVTNQMYYDCGFPYADFDYKQNPYSDLPNQPVNFVNWYEAMVFAKWLGYTLPSEAEWEYACRMGASEFMTEDMDELSRLLDKTARYASDMANKTREVIPIKAQYANELGVVDMLGNLREWCLDWYNDDFYKKCDIASYPTFASDIEKRTSVCYYWDDIDGEDKPYLLHGDIPGNKDIFTFDAQGNCVDPVKTIVGKFESKSLRGGCFDWSVSNLRPTYRNHNPVNNVYKVNGFRLVNKKGDCSNE